MFFVIRDDSSFVFCTRNRTALKTVALDAKWSTTPLRRSATGKIEPDDEIVLSVRDLSKRGALEPFKMINLLKNWMSPFAEPRGALSLLTLAAGLTSLPAFAEESAHVGSPSVTPQTEQLPAGFAEKSATVNGVRISYKIGGTGPGSFCSTVSPKRVICGSR